MKKWLLTGLAILVSFVIIIIVSKPISPAPDMKANVYFDGAQFHITNNNDFDWKDIKLRLNSDYELRANLILAGTEYTVGALQFAKGDGERFNPFTHKTSSMIITAWNIDGQYLSWSAAWK